MDTVILAGGRGSRLEGVMPPYYKPLMVVSGRPLISRLVDHAWISNGGEIIVVVAPENALPIAQVLTHREMKGAPVIMVVQPEPSGPGAALLLGLRMTLSEDVMVLMGDNVITQQDIAKVSGAKSRNAIGITGVSAAQAARLTYWTGQSWVEKEPVPNDNTGVINAWVGPFKANKVELQNAVAKNGVQTPYTQELPIGPAFNYLTGVERIAVTAFDIGVPEGFS